MTGNLDLNFNRLLFTPYMEFFPYTNTTLDLRRADTGAFGNTLRLNTLEAFYFVPLGTSFVFRTRGTGNQAFFFDVYLADGSVVTVAHSYNEYGAYAGEFGIPRAGDITLLSGKILNAFNGRLRLPSSAPASPSVGDCYYDAATDTLYIYNGAAWNPH